ncbi:glycosyltransferase family 4 protein [Candidatus Kaiserbacteria bacterium]|nr:glycosyltransferase family 4 protein [Candidatus Kaiserbacteria bacterium]
MRIHLYTLRLKQHGGGSHQNLMLFARALSKARHDVVVHALFAEGNDAPPDIHLVRERGDEHSFLTLQSFCASAMKRDETAADVLLVYGQALLFAAGMYRRQGGHVMAAVYLDSHLDSMKESYRDRSSVSRAKHLLWERTIGRLYVRSVDRYIAASPYLLERFARAGFPREKFVVIPNAFDFSDLSPKQSIDADVSTILYAGRLSREKGVDVLIDALHRLPRNMQWRAVLAGDGAQRGELEKMIAALKLSDRIRIAGWQNRAALAQEYASSDMLIVPSRVPEPFGRSIVEAMHAGLPVVVPSHGGAAWVAGEGGITFENGDSISLAAAIEKLLTGAALRRQRGEAGKIRARDFDVAVVGPMLEAELSNLVAASTTLS